MTTTRKAELAAELHLFVPIELAQPYKVAGVEPLCVTCEDIEDVAVHVKPLAANVEGLLHAGVVALSVIPVVQDWNTADMQAEALKVAAVNRVTLNALKDELYRLRLVHKESYGDYEDAARFDAYNELDAIFNEILAVLESPGAGYR
jgi:hypothetical protein